MKKIGLGIMITVVMIALVAPGAFSATITESGTSIGDVAFATSKNVTISILSEAQAYTAHSKHLNGNKEYCGCGGTASGCESIKSSDANEGDTVSDPSAADAGCQ